MIRATDPLIAFHLYFIRKRTQNVLCGRFDKLYLSYEIGVTKPDREIFDRMVLDSGIRPEETLFVDDGKNNIVVGQELGFHTYQPLNGEDWRGRLDEILSKS